MGARPTGGVEARPNRREDLLAAAARCFVATGIRKTTMEDIAREAGAGKATLYRHFANKDDLIDALLEREGERFRRRLERAVRDRDGAVDRIEAAFVAGVRFFTEHPVLAKGREEEPALLLERVTARRGPLVDAGLTWFADLVAAGVDAGEVRREVDPRVAAEVVMRLVLSYFTFPPMLVQVEDEEQARALAHAVIAGGLAHR